MISYCSLLHKLVGETHLRKLAEKSMVDNHKKGKLKLHLRIDFQKSFDKIHPHYHKKPLISFRPYGVLFFVRHLL